MGSPKSLSICWLVTTTADVRSPLSSTMPWMGSVRRLPTGVLRRSVPPVFRLLSSAKPLLSSTWPVRSVASASAPSLTEYRSRSVRGSMPETAVLPSTPATLAWLKRTALTSDTPGTRDTVVSTLAEKGEKPSTFWTTKAASRLSSTALAIVFWAPAAKIDAKVTSATPIISAAAVTAVRPGWRTLFSRARRPVMPVARSIGRPMREASGRTSRGLTSATPRNVAAAPAPVKLSAAFVVTASRTGRRP